MHSLGGRFTYGASRLQDNCLAVEVREGQTREGHSRAPSKVRGFSWKTPGGGRREEGEGKGRERRERRERGMRRGKEEEREKVVREEKEQDQVELLEGPVTIFSQDSQQKNCTISRAS